MDYDFYFQNKSAFLVVQAQMFHKQFSKKSNARNALIKEMKANPHFEVILKELEQEIIFKD